VLWAFGGCCGNSNNPIQGSCVYLHLQFYKKLILKIADFIALFRNDVQVSSFIGHLKEGRQKKFRLKGLVGSADACIAAAIYREFGRTGLYILSDKEEADYFFTDLKQLLPDDPVYYFPASYKKAYQYEDVDNANVLLRAEVLGHLNDSQNKSALIVTYPDALADKVINKKSLVAHTFTANTGDQIDLDFLSELLQTYGFEATDFVAEPGQFAVRGGIMDVFSFSNEEPYRIELWGNEIERIRTFNPESQVSVRSVERVSIIPNVQDRLLFEERESLLHYLGDDVWIWTKDSAHTSDVIDKHYLKAVEYFNKLVKAAGGTKVVSDPQVLFNTAESWQLDLKDKVRIEFGRRFESGPAESFTFAFKPQPSFNKDFVRLADDLSQHQDQGYLCVLVSDYVKQLDRLASVFETERPYLQYKALHIGLREGFKDTQNKLLCYTDHQIFERYYRSRRVERLNKSKAITIKELKTLQSGDFVTHIDHGIARFAGLEKVEVNGHEQEAIRLIFRDDDMLLMSIHALHKISKYSGKDGATPSMSKLGSGEWEAKKKAVKRKVKDIAKELIALYAKRKATPGFAFGKDTIFQLELESSFLYEDTPDQAKATAAVKEDMEAPHHMDRLVCGDVGFGKTEVAIRAAFKAADNGKQVAVLVPTTILAMQHYKTFKERLAQFPIRVEFINRFKSSKQINETLQRVKEGKTDILIGTHRLVSKDVVFKNLGLLIIDEEQKFGVAVKEKLKNMSLHVDVLTLTATPIPRTLQFSLMGARDLSVISTPPPNRQPVTTEVLVYNEVILRDAISFELQRNGQVFVVHNRVSDIEEIANVVLKLVPDARIGIAHGQMEGEKLEKTMLKFIEGEFDVLVSTNIIESGLDIPNANTIIINRAHTFGLSDLHQMRGRVGRSNKKAFCYLLTPPVESLPIDSKKRLRTLEEFSDLGDGFKVAMRDLDIRGAGNLLGGEQSGFVNDIGYEAYHKILDETIQELKETEFRELFKREIALKELLTDCVLETDLQILIPEQYVSSISERLALYTRLDNAKNQDELDRIIMEITDRFGPLPSEMRELVKLVQLRWDAEKLGFEKLVLKNGTMKAFFLPEEQTQYYTSDLFGHILSYIQSRPSTFRLKNLNKRLILSADHVSTADDALSLLHGMLPSKPKEQEISTAV
jgi:transcription-repair coupling factor (superfamily II helicase)